jgi:ComF family protein
MIAPLIYQGQIRKQIHDLKFNEKIYVANALLSHLWPIYANRPVDVLLPVPLHQSRLLERGFNQSTEIALILSRHLNIPLDRHSLTRIKATEFQFGLSLSKRQKNLLKAFCFNPEKQYQSVAIIDDIITSGSTMTEICKQLRKSGIKNIEVWSLARALKHD